MSKKDKLTSITEEEFECYLRVQKSGRYNMFDPLAVNATGLSKEKYAYILEKYSDLMIEYTKAYNKYCNRR